MSSTPGGAGRKNRPSPPARRPPEYERGPARRAGKDDGSELEAGRASGAGRGGLRRLRRSLVKVSGSGPRPRWRRIRLRISRRCALAFVSAALALAPAEPIAARETIWFDRLIGVEPPTRATEEQIVRYLAGELRQPAGRRALPPLVKADRAPRMILVSLSDGRSSARVLRGAGHGAGEAIRQLLDGQREPIAASWIKVDLVRDVVHETNLDPRLPLNLPRSLYGLAFDVETGLAFLPGELVAQTLVDSDQELRSRRLLSHPRAGDARARLGHLLEQPSLDLFRFSTSSTFVTGDELQRLYRGNRRFDQLTPELLLDSARRGARYLTRATGSDGRFAYAYRPKTDRLKDDYNILRHSGTLYSMMEVYEITREDDLLAAAERAIGYLRRAARPCAFGTVAAACVEEGGFVKLGGNALAIVALAKYAEITGSDRDRRLIDELGAWILATQSDGGEFTIHKLRLDSDRPEGFVSRYYPGEAVLALLRGGSEARWLDAAANGARWLIEVRDRDVPQPRLNHDHWLLYALDELHRRRPDPIYRRHASRITGAILDRQNLSPTYLDWAGSYYRPPRSTPTATRSEGLAAAYRLERDFGDPAEAQRILAGLVRGARFQLQTQFRPESVLYLRNPQRALGGFRRSLTHYEVRIDYVQHNISALLALRRILLGDRPAQPAPTASGTAAGSRR